MATTECAGEPSSSRPPTNAGSSSSVPGTSVPTHVPETSTHSSTLRQRPRTLPPWISSYKESYGSPSPEQFRLLKPPARIIQHQSNSSPNPPVRRVSRDGFIIIEDPALGPPQEPLSNIPHFLRYGRASKHGRKWDHLRSTEPVIVPLFRPTPSQGSAAWRDFIRSSAWGRRTDEESQVVSLDVLNRLQPTFNKELDVQLNQVDTRLKDKRRPTALSKRIWNGLMRHPLSPFLFRLGVMVTSILSLGIAARIYHLDDQINHSSAERTQSVVAVVVDCVAIPYIAYMTWDEYTGKPLGLRSAMSKISLILLDLVFIIFKSASTALAFESFIYHNTLQSSIIHLSMALAAFQLVGLISWSMTFTINVFRTVKRLGGGDDDDDGGD